MAFCANCGREMSDQATACPNCGHPVAAFQSDTPSGVTLAGFGVRFLGLMVDGIMLFIVSSVVPDNRTVRPIGTAIGFLYNWLMLAYNDGRTIGKMVMGIRIANPDGSRISVGTAAVRSGMALISGLTLGLGYLWAAWDRENRTWHDSVANTRAFRVRG